VSHFRRSAFAIVVAAAITIGPSTAQGAGAYTAWTRNAASGCYTRAQVPYLNLYYRVVAYPEVWCPTETPLTVRTRIRSDRTLSDVTVGTNGCTGTTDCVIGVPAGSTRFPVSCPRYSLPVRHGYHSDILIYPRISFGSATGSTSSSITYTSYCSN
jgi:hypothetical protein